ncbi:MAG: LCP family protein [Actinomycetales bacterium]
MTAGGRHRLRSLLLVACLLLVTAASAGLGVIWNLDRTINDNVRRLDGLFPAESTRPPAAELAPGTGATPVTVLFIGATTLPRASAASRFPADTVMVARISADRDRVDVVSLPADSMVPIPGFGVDRISAATTRGGVPLAVQTVEDLLETRIDHVVLADLDGVAEITDAVGGVEVTVTDPFSAGGRTYAAGTHTLDGAAALAFVREQASLPGRDLDRATHQQEYLSGLAARLTGSQLLAEPNRLIALLAVAADNVVVDADLSPRMLRSLAFSMRGLRADDVHLSTAAVAEVRVQGAGPLAVDLSEPGLEQLRTALAEDDFAAAY